MLREKELSAEKSLRLRCAASLRAPSIPQQSHQSDVMLFLLLFSCTVFPLAAPHVSEVVFKPSDELNPGKTVQRFELEGKRKHGRFDFSFYFASSATVCVLAVQVFSSRPR